MALGVQIAEDLEVQGERWGAQKHGSGVVFTRQAPAPHLVVDMHVVVSDPEVIDPWRVQQFAESKGQPLSYDEAQALLADQRWATAFGQNQNSSIDIQLGT